MTGVLNAMVGNSAISFTVGVATSGGSTFGVRALLSTFGTLTPLRTVRGADVYFIWSIPTTVDLDVNLVGVLPQDFFRYVAVQDGAGNIQIKTSASATHSDNGVETNWRWAGTGLWTAEHGDRSVTFFF